jgi:MinD superfamily P-loop ATPase
MVGNNTVSAGVILNKVTPETDMLASLRDYCKNNSISFLGVIPLDKRLLREPEKENPDDSAVLSLVFDEIWNKLVDTLQDTIQHHKETFNSTYIFN